MVARILEKIPAAIPLATRVDGIYFGVRGPDQLHEVEALAARNTYSVSQRPVFCLKDCKINNMPINPQQWNYRKVLGPNTRPWQHINKDESEVGTLGTPKGRVD